MNVTVVANVLEKHVAHTSGTVLASRRPPGTPDDGGMTCTCEWSAPADERGFRPWRAWHEHVAALVVEAMEGHPVNDQMILALRSHVEHAGTWPSGWVRWTKPYPWRVSMLLVAGLLVEGERTGEVHVTEAGRELLAMHS